MEGAKRYVKTAVFAVLVVGVLALDSVFGFSEKLVDGAVWTALHQLIERNMAAAVALYCVATVAGCVALALPGALFAVAAAVLFGPVMGTLWCVLAATVGAVLAFLAGRYFLRDAVRERAVRVDVLRRWLFSGSKRNEVVTLAVTRLVPLFPFNIQNFAYGATDMSLGTYTACTLVFMIPGTALYTFGTAGVLDADSRALYLGAACGIALVLAAAAIVLRRRFLEA